MRPDDAFYTPDGASFIASSWTRGPWDPRLQHGGPPTALMVRAMEQRAAADGDFQLARVTVDLLRAVPIDRCTLTTAPLRAGRRAIGYTCALEVGGRVCASASALFIRRAELPIPPELAVPAVLADPARLDERVFTFFREQVAYHAAMELRVEPCPLRPGTGDMWLRMRGRLVAGEQPSPAQRVAVAADAINGVGFALDFTRYTFVNADLTIYLHREPWGEYVRLQTTHTSQPSGRGLVEGALYDARGPIGRALAAQVLDQRQPA